MNDYVARCLAEASTSAAVCAVTLTYAKRDDLADKVLTPHHFQLFMKLLRRSGHKVRYLVAGEYGSANERAHFHAVLFFEHLAPLPDHMLVPRYKDDYPNGAGPEDAQFCSQIPQKRMVHLREWPHGHIICDWSASEKAVRYVCKYLLKEDKHNAWFSLSKKPALGAAYFAKKAAKAVELDVLPSSFNYLPPGGSKDRPYLLRGASRRDYLDAITTDPAKLPRMGEWVAKAFEKNARERFRKFIDAVPVPEQTAALDELREALGGQKAWMMEADRLRRIDYVQALLDDTIRRIEQEGGSYYLRSDDDILRQEAEDELHRAQTQERKARFGDFLRSLGLDPVEDQQFLSGGADYARHSGGSTGSSIPQARPVQGPADGQDGGYA